MQGRRGIRRLLTGGLLSACAVFLLGVMAAEAVAAPCPNESVRTGASGALPDCRAYELVSSPETNGRSFLGVSGFNFSHSGNLFPIESITGSGDSVVFMTVNTPLGDNEGAAGTLDVYEAARGSEGWQVTRHLSPSGPQAVLPLPGGISPDHLYAFVHVLPGEGGSLAASGSAEYLGAPDGSFELVGIGSVGGVSITERFAQGRYISAAGEHVILSTGRLLSGSKECGEAVFQCPVHRLADNAPPEGTGAVYDRAADGPTKVVSLLPGDVVPGGGEDAAYQGASRDGTTVAFKIGTTLYVRMPDSGDGNTLQVAEGDPVWAGLSDDGHYLFYVAGGENGTIHRFDTETEVDVEINPSAAGEVVNISADGSHIYFVSEEQIDGKGSVGQPNLYAWDGSTITYVATVVASDLERTSGVEGGYPNLTNWTDWAVSPEKGPSEEGPGADASRTTPDGSVLVFESKAQLTPYDNAGHTEIYRWDNNVDSLVCVSCNPTAEPATGNAQLQNLDLVRPPIALHNVSDDGGQVFFETTEGLTSEDVDGVNDIYEWHEESGIAKLDLISSGHSIKYATLHPQVRSQPSPNVIFGITPSGSDVTFLSQDELVAGAGSGNAPALYDARVGGGFPVLPTPVPCIEEGCKPNSSALIPSLAVPSSESLRGSGNVKARKRHPHKCHRQSKKNKKQKRCGKHPSKKKAGASSSSVDGPVGMQTPAPQGSASAEPATAAANGTANSAGALFPTTFAGEFDEYGIESVGAKLMPATAGAHPDFTTSFVLRHSLDKSGNPHSRARTESVEVSLPQGLLGNPNAIAKCKTGELLAFANCPIDSQVGITRVLVADLGEITEPIYNLEPVHPDREVARFGFYAAFYPVFIDVGVRTAGDYGVTATVHRSPGQGSILGADTVFWGSPADPVHDPQRLTAEEALHCESTGTACEAPGGKREVPRTGRSFMTNPSACQPGEVSLAVKSYQLPGQVFSASAPLDPITGCQGLPFEPSFSAEPTSHAAGAPTGLETKLVLPQHLGVEERATSTMREARVTLPEGMQIAAGAANWIDTCSEAQVGFHEEVNAACPDASKLGIATITSPSLPVPIEGNLYQRNPTPGHQFGLWLVADALGLHIKIPGELEPDKQNGRLTAVFSDLPQVPVEEIDLDVWGGTRAPLQNPATCGTYTTDFTFSPHSQDPAAVGQDQMQIDEGCSLPFDPTIHAGVENAVAGQFSPFVFDLTRPDGSQALRGFELHLPDGELAKLAGVPLCGEGSAAAGTCPADSRIGSLAAVSGPGPDPLQIPQAGKTQPAIYLAGPYQGAPYSIVSEVPAQAGPFDLGILAVRSALEVDPETARATVKADPLPQFFEGVGIAYRRLHAVVDRPGFSLNPTDCREMAVTSDVISTQGTVAHPAARFQVDGCKALKFKPKLSLQLTGGTKRGDYPALTATLKARKGDANIAKTSVGLPHSEFLAQEHIITICTRVQFAADKCPRGSIYGKAKAWTPLLDKPLEGPVYLRSSDHPLPDMVVALRGALEIDLVGRIDSHNGGIRSTFESVPDAPVSKFVLRMKGGAKGLLVNSTDICRGSHRASVAMQAQNGRAASLRPSLEDTSCSGKKLGNHKKHR